MSVLELSRWQFGITTVYHFLFVPITIGLGFLVAGFETAWNRTGDERWLRLTKFYGRLFLINFAMGVVTGIVQEFQFGMNWSAYSRFVGDIFGAPLAIEALLAFFLESTFLGLWIFGWDRLPPKVHAACMWTAATGTLLSAARCCPRSCGGVAFGNVLHGIPLNAAHDYAGNFFTLLNPYSLLGGLATLTLFTLDGALFLALKTMGDLRREATVAARLSGLAAVAAGGGFLAWTEFSYRAAGHAATGAASVILASAAAAVLLAALAASARGREGLAFGAGAVGIAAATGALFTALYPNVLPSTISAAYTLTTGNAASTAKTLAVMTVVACIFLPFVLAYQARRAV